MLDSQSSSDQASAAQTRSAAPSQLAITAIETVPIRVPLARAYRGSHYQMTHRSTIITRVHTESGLVGEAYTGDEDGPLLEIEQIVHEEIEPSLRGVDAFAVERCWATSRPSTFNILRDRRLALVASAGVDSAIWDAIGKGLGQPLWRLWGGFRSEIPMICIGGYYDSPMTIEEEIADLHERGVAGMKFKVGGRSPEHDAERFLRARAAAGDDFVLAADANQGWTREQALRFVELVADADLHWFEEPCLWHNDRLAMRDVRLGGGVRVCAGQSETSASACRDLMAAGAIDVCNFDASWSGGPTEWRRVAAIAHCYDVAMGHHEEPQISSHLLAAIPHGTFAECFHPDRDPIWWNLIANRPVLSDGRLQLSGAPGFGWELDLDYVERYRVRT